jgi:hypothetical protein
MSKGGYDPYKIDKNGNMGRIQIDKPLLNRLILKVHKDGHQIANQPIPYDLVELLTKRYSHRKQYCPESISLFQKLIRHSEIPMSSVSSSKFKNIIKNMYQTEMMSDDEMTPDIEPKEESQDDLRDNKNCGCTIKVFSSPEEVFTRLNILLGQAEAGNNAPEIINEIGQLLEYLHKHEHITDDGYSELTKACGLN